MMILYVYAMFLRVVMVMMVVVVVGVKCLTSPWPRIPFPVSPPPPPPPNPFPISSPHPPSFTSPMPIPQPPPRFPFTLPTSQHPPEDVQRCESMVGGVSCQHHGSMAMARCRCDPLCSTYGDCCYDSKFRNASVQVMGEGSVECHILGVYMKARCKVGWSDAEVDHRCVSGGVYADPMSRLPVTSKATGHTYSNYYCAICNQDILDLRIWNNELTCPGLNQTDHVNPKNLIFRDNSWGVLRGKPEYQKFVKCSLDPLKPYDVEDITRTCSPYIISTCSADWDDKEVEALCHSYSVVVYDFLQAYKNMYCLICNHADFRNYMCIGPPTTGQTAAPRPFSMIFDFTDPSHGNLVGSTSPCDATQVWDPFFKRCRSIVCPKPNQKYSYGKCVNVDDVNSMENSASPTTSPIFFLCLYVMVLIMTNGV